MKGIIFLGAPGSGKGTQAERLAASLSIPTISTGDMLRDHVKRGSEVGRKAKAFMDAGALVPDELILAMMREKLASPECAGGFILDGFPRNLSQARAFDAILHEMGEHLDSAIYLDVPEEEIVRRLTNRRVCPECGAIFHLTAHPPRVEGVCDSCGAALIQRDDDREDVIRHRLEVYREQTEPLIQHYQAMDILRHIIGMGSPDAIFDQVLVIAGGIQ